MRRCRRIGYPQKHDPFKKTRNAKKCNAAKQKNNFCKICDGIVRRTTAKRRNCQKIRSKNRPEKAKNTQRAKGRQLCNIFAGDLINGTGNEKKSRENRPRADDNKRRYRFFIFFNWDSLHARLNCQYKAWSYKKKKHKKLRHKGNLFRKNLQLKYVC